MFEETHQNKCPDWKSGKSIYRDQKGMDKKNEETVMRNYSKLIRRSPIGFSGFGISII